MEYGFYGGEEWGFGVLLRFFEEERVIGVVLGFSRFIWECAWGIDGRNRRLEIS